jgi:hypothetical protein
VWLVAAAKRSHPLALHVLAHCSRSSRPFPWVLPPTMLVVGTAGAQLATGPMAGGNNVEAEAPDVLAWLRSLGATGEYYAQHTLSEMYFVRCCVERHPVGSARVGLPRTQRQQGPVLMAWPTSGGVLWRPATTKKRPTPTVVPPRAGPGATWTCSATTAAAAPHPTITTRVNPQQHQPACGG